jgi:hypothetical protein
LRPCGKVFVLGGSKAYEADTEVVHTPQCDKVIIEIAPVCPVSMRWGIQHTEKFLG